MKIQIDTKTKLIILEEPINLDELFRTIKQLLPNDWKQYKLEIKHIISWTSPIVIERDRPWTTLPEICQQRRPLLRDPRHGDGTTPMWDNNQNTPLCIDIQGRISDLPYIQEL